MNTYIRKDIKGYYIEFPKKLDAEYWEGRIGSTYQDFLDGKWVMLSTVQATFHKEHPAATVREVLVMEITPEPVRTLEDAKMEKLMQIAEYDSSNAVNSFDIVVGGNTMSAWITPEQRSNYKNSLDSAELLGLTEVHPMLNSIQLTLSLVTAKMALAQIQIYADRCYIVTETHRANVNALDTIEAVEAYQYETGYPEKLSFNID